MGEERTAANERDDRVMSVFVHRHLLNAIIGISLIGCSPAAPQRLHGVVIASSGPAKARVIVTTVGTAIKETGPPDTIKTFGEVYAFDPSVFAVRRDQPTQITFWNLQPDDEHDFMLTDPANKVLLKAKLPPLSKTTYVMTFHDAGLFPFYCVMHQPAMSGQIVVTE
jgi:plastocyanin